MANVEQLKKDGQNLYPVTRAEAVYDDDDVTLQSRVDSGVYLDDTSESVDPEPWITAQDIVKGAITDIIYPVGSIYMSATLSTPAQVQAQLGGTWVAWGAGRVPVSVDTSQTEFDTVEETGGEKTHKITTSEMAAHTHGSKTLTGYADSVMIDDGRTFSTSGIVSSSVARVRSWSGADGTASYKLTVNATHEHTSVGSGTAHNNLQPYITCYMYKRTA